MILFFLRKLCSFVLFVLAQGLILNQLNVMGYATPLVALLFLLNFRRDSSRVKLLIWGFLLGIVMDLFTNTPGVGAASCTFLALLQPLLLNMFCPRESAEDLEPGMKTLGVARYCWYLLVSVLLFHCCYYTLQIFSFTNPVDLGANIVGGTLFTFFMMLGVNSFYRR